MRGNIAGMTPAAASQAHPPSYYAATANPAPPRPSLAGDADCDVCVIGGGYTGLATALNLAERGHSVVLLEQARIGWGASGRNGGQIGTGQRVDQRTLERAHGRAAARVLWDLACEAVEEVRARVERHRIACDWKPGLLYVGHTPKAAREEQEYAEWLRRTYGYGTVRPVSRDELVRMLASGRYHGGALDSRGGHLHPLNYALGLADAAHAAGTRLHEGTTVTAVEGRGPVVVRTTGGTVRARAAVLGCNGYLGDLAPDVAPRIMPINNFIVATAPLPEPRALIRDDVAVADSRFVVRYFRLSADGRLLFGGGENYSNRFPTDIAAFVRPHLLEVFPQLAGTPLEFAWGGTLAITMTRMPHVARLGDGLYVAHGYSGHGVAIATLAGKLIAEAVDGRRDRFDAYARIAPPGFPGGRWLRQPLRVLGMLWYALRDRL